MAHSTFLRQNRRNLYRQRQKWFNSGSIDPTDLALQLEQHRLTEPRRIADRDVYYRQHYDIGGGQYWANSFSAASKRALGWSHGAHGLRHSYAQDRMEELQQQGLLYQDALEVVSQEMGHFRSSITEVYLR